MSYEHVAKCPLPRCGADLYLSVSHNFIVEDTLTPVSDLEPRRAITDEWEVFCTEGHRLDAGSQETDGRPPLLGLRSALSLGGYR